MGRSLGKIVIVDILAVIAFYIYMQFDHTKRSYSALGSMVATLLVGGIPTCVMNSNG